MSARRVLFATSVLVLAAAVDCGGSGGEIGVGGSNVNGGAGPSGGGGNVIGEGGQGPGEGGTTTGGAGGFSESGGLVVAPTGLDFGPGDCGGPAPADQLLQIRNDTTAPMTVSLAINGSASFRVDGDSNVTLAAGEQKQVTVKVAPVDAGAIAGAPVEATLLVTNGTSTKTIEVPLRVTPQGATIELAPGSLDFGAVFLGTSSLSLPFTLKNTGNVEATVTLTPPSEPSFSLSSTSVVLGPGNSSSGLGVGFTPSTLNPVQSVANLAVTGAPRCGSNATSLTVEGKGEAGAVTVSGDLDFGVNPCGGSAAAPQTITIRNAGTESFTYTAVLGLGAESPYTISPATGSVGSGSGGLVSVVVTPKSIPATSQVPGNYADVVTITTTAPGDSPHVINLAQAAYGAILAFDTSSIDFKGVAVNSTQNAGLKIINRGNAPADVTATVDNPVFSASPTGSWTVATQDQKSLNLAFNPTNIDTQQGTLSLASPSVLCQPIPSPVSLRGVGVNGGIAIDTTSLDFGNVSCGTQATPKTFTLRNTGNDKLSWRLDLGRTPSPFLVQPNQGELTPGAQAVITVAPAMVPSTASVAANAFGDEITLQTNVIGDTAHVITLQQTAKGAVLAFEPSSLSFGNLSVNTTTKKTANLVNHGNAPINTTLTSSGARFAVTSAPNVNLGADATSTVEVAYTSAGSPSDDAGTVNVAAPAEGLCAPLPAGLAVSATTTTGVVSFSPQALDFGSVACGSTGTTQKVTFTNSGNAPYTVSVALAKGGSSPFTVSPATATVPAKTGSTSGTFSFTVSPKKIPVPLPQTSGVYGFDFNDTLTATVNGVTGEEPKTIALTQSARGSILEVTSPASFNVNFGSVALGAQGTYELTVANRGNTDATVNFINANPDSTFQFDKGVLISGGIAKRVRVTFNPNILGSINESATFTASNTTLCAALTPSAQNAVKLSGTGVNQPTLTVSPTSLNFGGVGCGKQAGVRTVTLTNRGVNPVSFTTSFLASPDVGYVVSPSTGTIDPQGQIVLQITAPPVPYPLAIPGKTFNDTLVVSSNAPGAPTINVALSQYALGAYLDFTSNTNGNAISLINVQNVNQSVLSSPAFLNPRNRGNVQVVVGLGITDAQNFAIVGGTSDILLGTNQTVSRNVKYLGTTGTKVFQRDDRKIVFVTPPDADICYVQDNLFVTSQ